MKVSSAFLAAAMLVGCSSLRAQGPGLYPGLLVRMTTGDSAAPSSVQTGRIDAMHGDTVALYEVSAGPIHNGLMPAGVRADIGVEHGHAVLGGLIGGLVGVLPNLSSRPGDFNGTQLMPILLIPLGALVGAAAKSITWYPLDTAHHTVEVGAATGGLGLHLMLGCRCSGGPHRNDSTPPRHYLARVNP